MPGLRAMLVSFVVNVAKLDHPPGDVREYVGDIFSDVLLLNLILVVHTLHPVFVAHHPDMRRSISRL